MTPSTAKDFPSRDPQLFYELARDKLATQLAAIDSLDNKIGLLVGLASGLLGVVAGVFALRSEAADALAVGLLILAGAAYAFVAYSGMRAYRVRAWDTGPKLPDVWKMLWSDADDNNLVKWRIANAIWLDYANNLPEQKAKTDALRWVFKGVILQTALVALALALVAVEA